MAERGGGRRPGKEHAVEETRSGGGRRGKSSDEGFLERSEATKVTEEQENTVEDITEGAHTLSIFGKRVAHRARHGLDSLHAFPPACVRRPRSRGQPNQHDGRRSRSTEVRGRSWTRGAGGRLRLEPPRGLSLPPLPSSARRPRYGPRPLTTGESSQTEHLQALEVLYGGISLEEEKRRRGDLEEEEALKRTLEMSKEEGVQRGLPTTGSPPRSVATVQPLHGESSQTETSAGKNEVPSSSLVPDALPLRPPAVPAAASLLLIESPQSLVSVALPPPRAVPAAASLLRIEDHESPEYIIKKMLKKATAEEKRILVAKLFWLRSKHNRDDLTFPDLREWRWMNEGGDLEAGSLEDLLSMMDQQPPPDGGYEITVDTNRWMTICVKLLGPMVLISKPLGIGYAMVPAIGKTTVEEYANRLALVLHNLRCSGRCYIDDGVFEHLFGDVKVDRGRTSVKGILERMTGQIGYYKCKDTGRFFWKLDIVGV